MRAAIIAASIVTIGLYLAIAAAFAFTPTWIGLGMLTISTIGATTIVVIADRPEEQAVR